MKKEQLEYINIIQQAISNNKLALFVGSGVSINSKIPSWSNLIKELAKELKIKKNHKFSLDETMKIPQLYFNEFSEVQYNEKVKSVLNCDNAKPNFIHDLLFELNPQYIITTNYDSLIEDASKEKKEFFSVIKQDADFPDSDNNKMIIKMHGDIETGNFVLKEDDYIRYSQDFILTETFIKGLFSTHVVLFIGYSISDPNVKQIFSWVNDVLGNKKPSAFLINIDDNCEKKESLEIQIPKEIENDYFKEKGIFKLDYSYYKNYMEKYRNKSLFKNKEADCLYDFLCFIKNYKDKTDIVDYFYKMISFLKPFNCIRPEDIITIFLSNQIKCEYLSYGNCLFSSNNDFKELISALKTLKRYPRNVKIFLEILKKADIEIISYNNNANIKRKKKSIVFDIPNLTNQKESNIFSLSEFDYINMLKGLENSKNILGVFQKAYIFFEIGKYIESYQELEQISYDSNNSNNYILYSIAEINKLLLRKQLSLKMIFSDSKKKTEEDKTIESILEKTNKTDIHKLVDKILPEQYRLIFSPIIDFSYFSNVFISLSERDSQLQNLYDNLPDTFDCHDYIHLNNLFSKFYNFLQLNFLFFNTKDKIGIDLIKNIIYLYVDASLKSYCTKNEIVYSPKKYFNYDNDIFIMIKHLKADELLQLFNKYNIKKLKLSEENIYEEQTNKKKIFSSFDNITNSIVEIGTNGNQFLDYYNNSLLILSRINITKKEFSKIIESYIKISVEPKYLKEFLKHIYNENPKVIIVKAIEKLVIIELEKLCNKTSFRSYYLENEEEFLFFLLKYFKLTNKKLSIPQNYSVLLATYMDKLFNLCLCRERMLNIISLYEIFNNETQEKIKLNLFNDLNQNFKSYVYYEACLSNIIQTNVEYEKKLFVELDKSIKGNKEHCIDFLNSIANLINYNKILNKEEFKKFLGKSTFFDFFFDMETFDYNEFDLKFLLHLSEDSKTKLIKMLKNKPEVKNILITKFKDLPPEDLIVEKYNNIKNMFLEVF